MCAQFMFEMCLLTTCVSVKIDELNGDISKLPTVHELGRLRQGKHEYWFWFGGTLLEMVAGVHNGWGQEKFFIENIIHATESKGQPMVTVTDEAFTLLLYDNYIKKWISRYQNGWHERVQKRMLGKYSSSASGEQGRSGWSKEGLKQFNKWVDIVRESRKAEGARERESTA